MPGFLDRLAAAMGGAAAPPAGQDSPPAPGFGADDARIPDATRPKVVQLLALAAEVEARGPRDPSLAPAAAEMRQMREQHLPRLIGSYHDIPPAHRAEIFRTTGKSASYQLNAAIDRMIAKAQALSRNLAAEDIESFAETLRFIDQRYNTDNPLG